MLRPITTVTFSLRRAGFGLTLLAAAIALWMTGCALNGPDRGGTGADMTAATPIGKANIEFAFQVSPTATPTAFASVRAAETSSASVRFRILAVNRGNAANPTTIVEKLVPVPPSGRATASFSDVPLTTAVAQVEAINANIDGFANFHGARDLVDGLNIITVNPTGSGFRHDLAAHMIEHAIITPALFSRLPANAAEVSLQLVGSLDRQAATAQEAAITALARYLNPPRWNLTVEQIRTAQAQTLGAAPASGSNDDWVPGDTFVTNNVGQDDVAGVCGWKNVGDLEPSASVRRFSTRAVTLPRAFSWTNKDGKNWLSPVKNQYPYSTCVAFACCAALEAMAKIQANLDGLDLSEWQLFNRGTNGDLGNLTRGWDFVTACNAVKSTGTVAENWVPYYLIPRYLEPVTAAKVHRADTFSLAVGAEAMKQALLTGPLVSGMMVYEDFMRYTGGIYWHATGRAVANHAILIVGYDDDRGCWICKNSWSEGWGEGGYFKVKYNQVQDRGYLLNYLFSVPAPNAPTSLAAVASDTRVDLTWPAVSGSGIKYNLYYANTTGVTRTKGIKVADVTSPYAHRNLTNDRPYYYVVTAENITGESVVSVEASATPRANPMNNVTATAGDRQLVAGHGCHRLSHILGDDDRSDEAQREQFVSNQPAVHADGVDQRYNVLLRSDRRRRWPGVTRLAPGHRHPACAAAGGADRRDRRGRQPAGDDCLAAGGRRDRLQDLLVDDDGRDPRDRHRHLRCDLAVCAFASDAGWGCADQRNHLLLRRDCAEQRWRRRRVDAGLGDAAHRQPDRGGGEPWQRLCAGHMERGRQCHRLQSLLVRKRGYDRQTVGQCRNAAIPGAEPDQRDNVLLCSYRRRCRRRVRRLGKSAGAAVIVAAAAEPVDH